MLLTRKENEPGARKLVAQAGKLPIPLILVTKIKPKKLKWWGTENLSYLRVATHLLFKKQTEKNDYTRSNHCKTQKDSQ